MSENPKWPPSIYFKKTQFGTTTCYIIFPTFLGARNPKKKVIMVFRGQGHHLRSSKGQYFLTTGKFGRKSLRVGIND